jgi:hypothetical protein
MATAIILAVASILVDLILTLAIILAHKAMIPGGA